MNLLQKFLAFNSFSRDRGRTPGEGVTLKLGGIILVGGPDFDQLSSFQLYDEKLQNEEVCKKLEV